MLKIELDFFSALLIPTTGYVEERQIFKKIGITPKSAFQKLRLHQVFQQPIIFSMLTILTVREGEIRDIFCFHFNPNPKTGVSSGKTSTFIETIL